MFTTIKATWQAVRMNRKNQGHFSLGFDFNPKVYSDKYKYPVYISNRLIESGVDWVSGHEVPFAIASQTRAGENIIVINELLAAMDPIVVHAVILHEEGHLALGHLDSKCANNEEDQRELDADAYALEHGGEIAYAFEQMYICWKEMGYHHLFRYSMGDRVAAVSGSLPKESEAMDWTILSGVATVVCVAVGLAWRK